MRVGIIQPNYLPWRGYFDFIASVDVFIFLDDVQYTPRDWRNRNQFKTPRGLAWVTVPVVHAAREQLICDTAIDHAQDWRRRHLASFDAAYARAPHYATARDAYAEVLLAEDWPLLADLDIALTQMIAECLGITTPLLRSRDLAVPGRKSEKLLNLVKAVGGDTYISGPAAQAYLDRELFTEAGVRVGWKRYDYPPYPQLWGGFAGTVSVLDLVANCGWDCADLWCCREGSYCLE